MPSGASRGNKWMNPARINSFSFRLQRKQKTQVPVRPCPRVWSSSCRAGGHQLPTAICSRSDCTFRVHWAISSSSVGQTKTLKLVDETKMGKNAPQRWIFWPLTSATILTKLQPLNKDKQRVSTFSRRWSRYSAFRVNSNSIRPPVSSKQRTTELEGNTKYQQKASKQDKRTEWGQQERRFHLGSKSMAHKIPVTWRCHPTSTPHIPFIPLPSHPGVL